MRTRLLRAWVLFVASTCLPPVLLAESHDVEIRSGGAIGVETPDRKRLEQQYDWHAHLLWESRYLSEGRDNLAGNGIVSASTEFSHGRFTIAPWAASGAGADYTELNFNVLYGFEPGDDLELYIGYNRLLTRQAGVSADDDEINLELVYFRSSGYELLAGVTYSFEAEGVYTVVELKKVSYAGASTRLELSTGLGINAGYVVGGHDGLDHVRLQLGLYYLFANEVDVSLHAGYNKAIDRDSSRYAGDATLRDVFWTSAGVSVRF